MPSDAANLSSPDTVSTGHGAKDSTTFIDLRPQLVQGSGTPNGHGPDRLLYSQVKLSILRPLPCDHMTSVVKRNQTTQWR